MKQIRRSVFETNSSSTHSITMCMKSEYDRWEAGEFYWRRWDCEFVPVKKADKEVLDGIGVSDETYSKDEIDKIRRSDYGFYTYDEFWDGGYIEYEDYCESFLTPGGEKVVAFGYYGQDY